MRSFGKGSLSYVTASAMAIATFPITAFAVLASELIDEFDVSRAQIGLLVTATGVVGALSSPGFGRLTDRLGPIRSTRGVLLLGTLTLVGVGLAPTYGLLVVGALSTGLPNGWSNPATNSLIVSNLAQGARGVVTGIKQSGVQVGTFLGGLLLPPLAAIFSWRLALGSFIIVPLVGLLVLGNRTGTTRAESAGSTSGPVPRPVRWVAIYGALSGFSTSAMFGFLPLFAEEDQLWSPAAAGSMVAIVGLIGIAARVGWPAYAERRLGYGPTLRVLASLTATSAVLLALIAGDLLDSWALVPAAILLGGGAIAWNAVGMLAVMDLSSEQMVGKSTGLVLLGFLSGVATGAPVMGWSVDTFETYVPGFAVVAGLLIVDAVLAGLIPARVTVRSR